MTFADNLKQAINIAQSLAKESSNGEFSPAHLLKALLHKNTGLTELLMALDQDIYYLEEWADVRIESCPKSSNVPENPPGDSNVQAVFREAETLRLKLSKDETGPEEVLAALSTPGVGFSYEQLKTFTLSQKQIIDYLLENNELQNVVGTAEEKKKVQKQKPSQNALMKFCTDKTEEARQGKLDPVVCRDNVIREITEILGRRNKANVLIIGDAGVGKTSLVNGFALNITENKVPPGLAGALVFELDYGALIAGASYKGEIEDRLKNIITEIRQFDKAILFIDELHMLLDKQGGTAGAANLLKPELARGNLTVIGTTSIDNYTKFIETDEAFNRQFELVKLEEPDEQTAKRMLMSIMPKYEEHHKLKVDEEIITEAIRLSKRYLKERSLPESAIDLIDHTMAGVRLMTDISPSGIKKLKTELEKFTDDKNVKFAELQWFSGDLKNQISPILFSKLNEEEEAGLAQNNGEELFSYCKKILDNLEKISEEKIESLTKSDVGAIVSGRTGIPLGKIQAKEREKLMNTEDHLRARVIGQDHALKSIAEAILESRSGLNKAGQPIGSFFFLGPTGTGKTELAKSLAEFLFQDEAFLLRFDMSEFKEEHSAALLYGAPPGYVGYEEGGLLVNKIRQKPYSIVLFDEIEKAHSSVFDIFLQILDEGKLHDRLGKEGDFSNALIIFTSNIGSNYIVESFDKGEIPPSDKLMEIMSNYFRPEFLARLTEIVPFAPISRENVVKIFEIHMKSLLKTLDDKGIKIEITDDAKEKLAMSGYTPKYGARPIVGVIRNQLRRPLSKMIIADKITRGSVVRLKIDENEKVVWEVN
jgi:ATP-dependent Clp protease ATP-binding subunit ClpB